MWSKAKFLVILLCEFNKFRFYRERCKLQPTSLFRSKHDVHPPTPPFNYYNMLQATNFTFTSHEFIFKSLKRKWILWVFFSASLFLSVSCLSFLHLSPHHHHTIKCVLVGTYHFYMTMRLHHQISWLIIWLTSNKVSPKKYHMTTNYTAAHCFSGGIHWFHPHNGWVNPYLCPRYYPT